MPDAPTTVLNRFQSTVPFYARFRLGYPDRLIARVAALSGLKPGDRVLDLGCGPGLLALPFARAGMAVTAVDPAPAMLEALKGAAEAAQLRIDIRPGSSSDLPEGPFRLVVIGRAFHWMDRIATARALDRLVVPEGALALFDDEHVKTVENRWRAVLDEVAGRYGANDAAHRRERADPGHRSHESILLDSPFARLESAGVVVARELTADDIVGYAQSLSVTSREALKERAAPFEAELRAGLAALAPDGRFREIAEMRALVAKKGG